MIGLFFIGIIVSIITLSKARLQSSMAECLRGKRHAERQYSESVMYKCWKGSAELEDNIDGSKSIKKLIID